MLTATEARTLTSSAVISDAVWDTIYTAAKGGQHSCFVPKSWVEGTKELIWTFGYKVTECKDGILIHW